MRWTVLAAVAVLSLAAGAIVYSVSRSPHHQQQQVIAKSSSTTTTSTSAAPSTTAAPLATLPPIATTTLPTPATIIVPPAPTTAAPTTTSTTVAPLPCTPEQVQVAANPDRSTYQAGEPVVVGLTLVDTAAVACTVARPAAWATVTIDNADTTIAWYHDEASGATLLLHPQQATSTGTVIWAQYECGSPCGTSGPAAGPGTYTLQGAVQLAGGTATSVRVSISIEEPPPTTSTTPATSVPPSTAPAAGA